jgi:Zn-dependent protease with chaperone function
VAIWLAGWLAWWCAGCWVRSLNHRIELRADRTAVQLLGSAEPVFAMLERLHDIRADHNRRQRIEAWFTHPTPERRRRALTGA